MHLLLSVTMVAAAGVGVVTAAAGRRPHPFALAQAVVTTGAMLLHALGLLGAGTPLGSSGSFAVAALLLASSLGGLAGERRSSAALTRAVMGIAMAFLLVATSPYASPLATAGTGAGVTHHSAMAAGASAGAGSALTAALLGAVALAAATAVAVRMLRTRRYGSGVECLSMGVCLAGMGAMALV